MISRRQFLLSAAVLPPALRSAMPFALSRAPQRIYIGTGNRGSGTGILTATWDASGNLGVPQLAAEVTSPTFLAQGKLRDGTTTIYSVSEVSGPGAQVSAFTADNATGTLRLLSQVSTMGDGPTHLSLSPDGRCVLVANYGGGSLSSYRVHTDGSLSEAVSRFQFTGSGPNRARQEAPHTHSAACSPDGRFALVNDLGIDRIMVFRLDSAAGKLSPNDPPYWTARPGSGPRHLSWSADGRFVYCSNELDASVEILAWSEPAGTLSSLGHVSTLPNDFSGKKIGLGEIITSPDGRTVYAGNRVVEDTIAVFQTDRRTGMLQRIQLAPSGGRSTRHIALDPSGHWMIASHQDSDDLTVLQRDPATGTLTIHGTTPVHKPMYVLFVT